MKRNRLPIISSLFAQRREHPGSNTGVSRRKLLNAGGASAVLLVLSQQGAAESPAAIALPSPGQGSAASGHGYLVTVSPSAEGTFALTKVGSAGATRIAHGLINAVASPDHQSAAYAHGRKAAPLHAPSRYSVLDGRREVRRQQVLRVPGLGHGYSFASLCVLPEEQGAVVGCCDLAHSAVVEPHRHKGPSQSFSLAARTVFVFKSGNTTSLPLPVGHHQFIGTEVVPIDGRHAAVITSGLTRKITGKANRSRSPNTAAHCHIVDTAKGELTREFPVLAGPGAADCISCGNGVVARRIGGSTVELIYPCRPPVSFEVPLAKAARRYVPAGYADPAAGALVLFDFAPAHLLKIDLDTGHVAKRSVLPLSGHTLHRVLRPAADVDTRRRQLLLADPSHPRSGVWLVDLDQMAVSDRWLSLMPVRDIRVMPGTDRVVVRSPGSATALLVDHNGQVAGSFELAGQLV